MPGSVLQEAMTYYQIEPFGAERDNLHAAVVATTIANGNRGKNKPPFKVDDFMIKSERKQKQAGTNEFLAFIQAVAVKKDGS